MTSFSPLLPPIPTQHDRLLHWGQLYGPSLSLAVSHLEQQSRRPILLITPDISSAQLLVNEIRFFMEGATPLLFFPNWEILPYDHFSPHEDLISQRLHVLTRLTYLSSGIVVSALPTLLQRLCPREFITQNSFVLSRGEKLQINLFRQNLIDSGYRQVEQVFTHSEFALRGSIIDLYPMGSEMPFRIELFDNDVETIRYFDPETQRSAQSVDSIEILPAREFPLTENKIQHFRQSWRERFSGNPLDSPIYSHMSEGHPIGGIENYLPLFFDQLKTIFEYLPEKMIVITTDDLSKTIPQFWREINERYEQLRYDPQRPLCAPHELFIPENEFFQQLNAFTRIYCQATLLTEKKGHFNFATTPLPPIRIQHKLKEPFQQFNQFIQNYTGKTLLSTETPGRREILLDLLKKNQLIPEICERWHSFLKTSAKIAITVSPIDIGCLIKSNNIALITETELFGEQVQQRRFRKERKMDPNTFIRDLSELKINDPVVHIDHGIGRYRGLESITTGNVTGEYLILEYADQDKIYVPIQSLHLISRYTGADQKSVTLQKLGSGQWNKTKTKTMQRIYDVAAELLNIYSQRAAKKGHAFSPPSADYQLFRNSFPFEETPDQTTAINAVIQDMMKSQPMDRLVCGDVGFGKTEVAMQATFLATQDHKQVAILAPTTLLVEQHLHNFQDRFADWPIKIAGLSRLKNKKEQTEILDQLATGKIDIIIGTHKLLQSDIYFKDLGLLIVDEEHRFGVRQKEKIKALRTHVDILALTATPIPRTLNMSLSGIRDISLITTPPARRLSVKTFVLNDNSSLIREAIMREIMRGGQTYFLHNEVSTILSFSEKLKQIVPEAKIAIAHGQMRERELEKIMADFYHQKNNVLICTTIIESGIDVPTANTIIIQRADRFGLAQLHQLRGRVGRSHHQAYAYLFVPDLKTISSDAKQRLRAIAEAEELGAGFQLATHDLEIRGAGEILGEEQSGHIEAIGFTLFMELLDEAIEVLKKGGQPSFEIEKPQVCDIDLQSSALIPEKYISDINLRLTLYKRLSNCKSKTDIENFKVEMIDRFGTLPNETNHLIDIAELKLRSNQLGIQRIQMSNNGGYLEFKKSTIVEPAIIVKLIQKYPKKYQLKDSNRFRINQVSSSAAERITILNELFDLLFSK